MEMLPMACILVGLLVCTLGSQGAQHFVAFCTGCAGAALSIFTLFQFDPQLLGSHSSSFILLVALLGASLGGIIGLLLRTLMLAMAWGTAVAIFMFVASNGIFFSQPLYFIIVCVVLSVLGVGLGCTNSALLTSQSTAFVGAMLVVLGIDQYAGKGLTSMILGNSLLASPFGVVDMLAPTCTSSCYRLLVFWIVEAILGLAIQHYLNCIIGKTDTVKPQKAEPPQPARAIMDFDLLRQKKEGAQQTVHAYHAGFNYFGHKQLPPDLLGLSVELRDVFGRLAKLYGFQKSSSDNQLEHLSILLGNHHSRAMNHMESIDRLHSQLCSNYRAWCRFLGEECHVTTSRTSEGNRSAKVEEMALWLLMWGESSNLRMMPECLCFLYHGMTAELNSVPSGSLLGRPVGHFLAEVVTPLYDIVSAEKGDIHTKKRNYDDFNEFFWTRECLSFYYGTEAYHPSRNITPRSSLASSYSNLEPLRDGLQHCPKTYTERRSHLHPVYAFYRIYSWLMVGFHVLVCVGLLQNTDIRASPHMYWLDQETKVYASVVVVIAGLSLLKELIGLCITRGSYSSSLTKTGVLIRVMVKGLFFVWLALFYTWSWERNDTYFETFKLIALVYLAPQALGALGQIFPTLNAAVRNLRLNCFVCIQPLGGLFPAHNSPEPCLSILGYQLFWVSLLALKFYASYLFQIQPLITPTINLLYAKHNLAHRNIPLPGVTYFLVAATWLPFVLVYLFDTMIWYAVWQAGVGALVGFQEKLGEIRTFGKLREMFERAPEQFEKKILNISHAARFHASAGQKNTGKYHNATWRRFGRAWNMMIADLRTSDHISNEEQVVLEFRFPQDAEHDFYLPLLLTCGVPDVVVAECVKRAALCRQPGDCAEQERRLTYFFNEDPLKIEAVAEIWELLLWLFKTLLGPRHETEVEFAEDKILLALSGGHLLATLNLEHLPKLMEVCLNFVRALRFASSVFKRQAPAVVLPMKPEHDVPVGQPKPSEPRPLLRSIVSSGTLTLLETVSRRSQAGPITSATDLHVNLLRDQVRAVIGVLCSMFKYPASAQGLQPILVDETGFHWDDEYANHQVRSLLSHSKCADALRTLFNYFTVAEIDSQPRSAEAQRRLLFFLNSLFMNLPAAPSLRSMYSWTVLTPFYSEDILYSTGHLQKETEDGVSTFLYLQTVYPMQWKNFCQRINMSPEDSSSVLAEKEMEARMWATQRGQTLGRTATGMMMYEKALQLLGALENPDMDESEISNMVMQKFQYVISAQVYGKQKREMDPKGDDLDHLLKTFPTLRVAYIDCVKVQHTTESGSAVFDEFYSVLVKSVANKDGTKEIQEVYRIKLPGNPIIGEGKPENQNHAIIFTRGEMLQAIDMNQENYLEEAFKMRNLLEEFELASTPSKPCTIMGFREHIYTGSLSSVANYMALQEGCFVTLGQRVLAKPLKIRLHYGHPDVFDKMWFMGRGGVSKASVGVNLSEDIFAGFNAVARGGGVSFKEYIQVGKGRDVGLQQLFKFEAKLAQGAAMQCFTRDVWRIAHSLDFCRLLSFYFGGLGFYISNSITICALYLFLYARVFLSSFHFDDPHAFSGPDTIAYWFGQIGVLMALPIFAATGVDQGFTAATWMLVKMMLTGGPLFFIFHMGTKAHYFNRTILAGGAKYRPTGRGFVTSHENFGSIYRFHAFSHFYKAVELMLMLALYAVVAPRGTEYGAVTWAGWLIAGSWLFAPFWFNPMCFQWDKTVQDYEEFLLWMARREGPEERSWKTWWSEEISYLLQLDILSKLFMCVLSLRHALVGIACICYNESSRHEVALSGAGAVLVFSAWGLLRNSENLLHSGSARVLKVMLVIAVLVALFILIPVYDVTIYDVAFVLLNCIGISYFVMTFSAICLIFGARWGWIESIHCTMDRILGTLTLGFLGLLSIAIFPSMLQTRLMFHNAFSRGVLIDQLLKGTKKKKSTAPSGAPAETKKQSTVESKNAPEESASLSIALPSSSSSVPFAATSSISPIPDPNSTGSLPNLKNSASLKSLRVLRDSAHGSTSSLVAAANAQPNYSSTQEKNNGNI